MKMILLAASALAFAGMAQAQDATQPPATPPADSSTMAPPAAPADPAASAPAAPASGVPADTAAAAASTDDSNLPACSKTVTDKCKQGGGAHHGRSHHRK